MPRPERPQRSVSAEKSLQDLLNIEQQLLHAGGEFDSFCIRMKHDKRVNKQQMLSKRLTRRETRKGHDPRAKT